MKRRRGKSRCNLLNIMKMNGINVLFAVKKAIRNLIHILSILLHLILSSGVEIAGEHVIGLR